jgi:phosphatidylinositol alpha-1,6-mannosyltransferase
MSTQALTSDRRRVLLILGEVFANGGIQRFNQTLMTACARLNVECDVLTLNDTEASRVRWAAPASARVRVFGRRKVAFAIATISRLWSRRYDAVVIGHINMLTLVVGALAPLRRTNIRTLLVAHGIEIWSSVGGLRRLAIRAVSTSLCVSRYTAAMIKRQAPEIPDERLGIFPNALSESWVHRFEAADDIVARLPLPERYLLSVTRLDKGDRYKGIATALESFAMLADQSLHYVIAGRGDDVDFLEAIATRMGVGHRVHFVGSLCDLQLAELYRGCVAFVLPSGKEGFGIVFLEAMYFGAPVIAAAAKGAMDVVEHERTGLLVPYGDTVALKDAMERLVGDEALRHRLRGEARQSVNDEGQFTFGAFARRLAVVLDVPHGIP